MHIGELARTSGFTIDTLRYYDRIGLVRPARRNPVSRFREYEPQAIGILTLVKRAKVAGLSLPQIRRVVVAAQRGAPCKTVVPLLDGKIAEIDRAIRALQQLRSRLVRALRQGTPKGRPNGCTCPILKGLSDPRPQEGV